MGEIIEAIVFDKDGTLFDFEASWRDALLSVLEQLAPGDASAAKALGIDPGTGGIYQGSIAIAGTTFELAEALAPYSDQPLTHIVDVLNAAAGQAPMVPVVDLRPCLQNLGQGRALGLVTNDTEAPARAHLEEAGILDMFDFVAGYDSGFGAKPEPGQLLAFAKATGVLAERTLMVGDSPADLMAGHRAGMRPLGVLTGVADREDLAPFAEAVLADIGDLAAWISEAQA